ncbi:MAG: DUF92 domain-containing protein [Chloroflexi bacterium HGW-Chloroflexi-3]|nr:MAG: DUF92 domain-containing protein [Chloroflexi bacterium HGW-Chloroflexi-3]
MAIFNSQLLVGFLLALLFAFSSFKIGFLSKSGAMAACLLGTIVFGLGGFAWAVVLLGFFVSSSVLSKLFKRRKASLEEKFSKGSKRDAWQVWANGGVAGIFVILHAIFPDSSWPWLAFCGTMAAVNADTWATELGVLSKKNPINLVTGQSLEPGESGGVTTLGTLAAFLASLFIAILAILFWPAFLQNSTGAETWLLLIGITSSGVFGSLVDSFLGATVQAIYFCPACTKETEKHPQHTCGRTTELVRGWKWFTNDVVNTFCAFMGGFVMILSTMFN